VLIAISLDAHGALNAQSWQQIAAAPFSLPGTESLSEGNKRLFQLRKDAWSEWHIPAPGTFAVRLGDGIDANDTLKAFTSNGSGLLVPVGFTYHAKMDLWVVPSAEFATRIVHISALNTDTQVEAYYLEDTDADLAMVRTLDSPLSVKRYVRDYRLTAARPFDELKPGSEARFAVTGGEVVRLRMRMPFTGTPRAWQDFQLSIFVDGRVVSAPRLRTFQDRKKAWYVDGNTTLLSLREDYYVELPESARILEVKTTHRLLLRAEVVGKDAYFFPQWNVVDGPAHSQLMQNSTEMPEQTISRILHKQELRQKTLRLAEDNMVRQAPLQAVDWLTQTAGTTPDIERLKSRMISRYTELLDLLPHQNKISVEPGRAFHARYVEYRGPRLLDPKEHLARRWLGSVQLSSAANRVPGAWFVRIGPQQSLNFNLRELDYEGRIRVVVEHRGQDSAAIMEVRYPTRSSSLLLDANRARPDRYDPADTGAWSRGIERLTDRQIGYAEIAVPAATSTVSLGNTSNQEIWLAIQQRVPTTYTHNERDWIHLLSTAHDDLSRLWWLSWAAGMTESDRWQAKSAMTHLPEKTRDTVNGWMPTLHYLAEQYAQFSSRGRVRVVNLHCAADDQSVSQDGASVEMAGFWEASAQWINAAQTWRDAIPGSQGDVCVRAHLGLTRNLFRAGSHHLAESYLRTLVRDSESVMLRDASIQTLHAYYKDQRIEHAVLQLAAYAGLKFREPKYLRDLVYALFDTGHDRAGLDLAMVVPALHGDDRVIATLVKSGWVSLLDLLRSEQSSSGSRLEAFAQLTTLRNVAVDDLQFSDSVMLQDRLLDTTKPLLVSTPSKPVTFSIAGPARLRLSLRPFGEEQLQAAPNGWAMVKVDGKSFPFPISMHTDIARYDVGENSHVVGALTQEEFDLGPGVHSMSIEATSWSLALSMHARKLWHSTVNETLQITDARVSVLPETLATGRVPEVSASFLNKRPLTVALPDNTNQLDQLLERSPTGAATNQQVMRAMTYLTELDPQADNAIQARAEWWSHVNAEDRQITRLRDRMRRQTAWAPVELTHSYNSTFLDELTGFRPESEYWRLRNLFLPEWKDGEILLSSGERLDLALTAPTNTALKIEFEYATVMTAQNAPINIRVDHNGAQREISLIPQGTAQTVLLELAPADHQIAVSVDEFDSASLVKVFIAQRIDTNWETISRSLKRRYYVADELRPVEIALRGPAWLRVDEQTRFGVRSHYQYLGPGDTPDPLLKTVDGVSLGRYRVFSRQFRAEQRAANDNILSTASAAPWPAAARLDDDDRLSLPGQTIATASANQFETLLRQDAPTYSIATAWQADDESSEDTRFPVNNFFESTITRRHRDSTGYAFDEVNLSLRTRSSGASLGGTYYHWRNIEDTPFSVRADARFFAQDLDEGSQWSVQGKLALRHGMRAGLHRYHSSELSYFSRYLSADTGGPEFDPDVFTPYRRDHLNGAEIQHRISWQNYQDLRWYTEAGLRSNELNKRSTDSLWGLWGSRTQLGLVQVSGEFQVSHYLADDDRKQSLTVPRLKLRGRWYGAPRAAGRWEFRTEARYDFDIDRLSGVIAFTWHFDGEQVLDDFHGERYWLDRALQSSLENRRIRRQLVSLEQAR
jgi:hypothetical protein